MASSYSQYLRLELIGTGEQTGTWGNTTNTNLGTLLDQAVAGTATIDVTAGNVTLTALNGASDQSRQAILKITGTPGAARNVIAPESSKWYLVSNECGQTITLKGASTSGYAIADGETLLMFWNGTDFVPGSSTALGYTPVNKAGDTMTGALYLPAATPTLSTQAANKAYVDAAVSGAVGGNFVLKAGDTMTGPLVLPGAPTLSLQAATKGYVDGAISGAGFATQAWVTSQNYVTTTTSSLTNYYTKTDSDNRYVATSTQNLQYYTLTSQLGTAVANLGFVTTSTTGLVNYSTTTAINTALSSYALLNTTSLTNYYTKTTLDTAFNLYLAKADNLSGLGNTTTARSNLGTGGLTTTNAWSGANSFSGVSTFTNAILMTFNRASPNNTMLELSGAAASDAASGAVIKMTNPNAGSTVQNKNLRVNQQGEFEVVNSAYNAVLLNVTNTGLFYLNSISGKGYQPGGGSWYDNSDVRVKENIVPLTGSLNKIMALKPVAFDWKYDRPEVPGVGFIAQDVEKIIPSAVTESEPRGEQKEFIPEGEKIKNIGWGNDMTAYLVGAIQELKAELDALKAAK